MRQGEFSTPVKLIVVSVAAIVVLLIYITLQEGLLQSVKDPIRAFMNSIIGGIG